MPANLESSTVAIGLEKISFHFNPKERQCQRMFKLLHNSTHFTCYQGNAQNPSNQPSTVRELRTSRCRAGFGKCRLNCQQSLDHRKREFQKNIHFCFIDYTKAFDCVDHNKLWKILKQMRIPDHLSCPLRNLYAGQEATVRTGHGTTDWFQIGKGECQGCISSPCLFNAYAVYTLQRNSSNVISDERGSSQM